MLGLESGYVRLTKQKPITMLCKLFITNKTTLTRCGSNFSTLFFGTFFFVMRITLCLKPYNNLNASKIFVALRISQRINLRHYSISIGVNFIHREVARKITFYDTCMDLL